VVDIIVVPGLPHLVAGLQAEPGSGAYRVPCDVTHAYRIPSRFLTGAPILADRFFPWPHTLIRYLRRADSGTTSTRRIALVLTSDDTG
jgi:hypothetical protein